MLMYCHNSSSITDYTIYTSVENSTINCQNSKIYGNGAAAGIYIDSVDYGNINSCYFINGYYGIYLTSTADNTTITNNKIENSTYSGIFSYGNQRTNIYNNIFRNSSIYFDQPKNYSIWNNSFYCEQRTGDISNSCGSSYRAEEIHLRTTGDGRIYNNTFSNALKGISIYKTNRNLQIYDNTFTKHDRAITINDDNETGYPGTNISRNIFTNNTGQDAYNLDISIVNSTNIRIQGNMIKESPDVSMFFATTEEVIITNNSYDMVCLENRAAYPSNAQNEPCTAISIKQLYKTWCYIGCESVYNITNVRKSSSRNFTISNNAYDNDTNVYILLQGATNMSVSATNYWYRSFRLNDLADKQEYYINNNWTEIRNYVRGYNTTTRTKSLYEGWNGFADGIPVYYGINSTELYIWTNQTTATNNITFQGAIGWRPYNDIKNITTGQILYYDVDNQSMELHSSERINMGYYDLSGSDIPENNSLVISPLEAEYTRYIPIIWQINTTQDFTYFKLDLYNSTGEYIETINQFNTSLNKSFTGGEYTSVNTYTLQKTIDTEGKIVNKTQMWMKGTTTYMTDIYLKYNFGDGTTEDTAVQTTASSWSYMTFNSPNNTKTTISIDIYTKRHTTNQLTVALLQNITSSFNYVSRGEWEYTWETYPDNLELGYYYVNVTAYNSSGTAFLTNISQTFHIIRNTLATFNLYRYGTTTAINNATLNLSNQYNESYLISNGETQDWIRGLSYYNITAEDYMDTTGNFTITEANDTITIYMLPQRSINFNTNTTAILNAKWDTGLGFSLPFYTRIYKNTTNVILVDEVMADGKAQLVFNGKNITGVYGQETWINHTQWYEWIVEGNSEQFAETVQLINVNSTEQLHIQVIDKARQLELENAVIRLYGSLANNTERTSSEFLGQRLTDSDGYTYFIIDDAYYNGIEVSKEGYETKYYPLPTSDNAHTSKAEAWVIDLQSNDTADLDFVYIVPPVGNFREDFTIGAVYSGWKTLMYSTSGNTTKKYAQQIGAVTSQYAMPLYYGDDYDESTANLTLYIWLDATLYTTFILEDQTRRTDMLDRDEITEDTATGQETLMAISYIILILGVVGLQWLFKGGETFDTIGFNAFMIGGMGLILISTAFWLLSLTCGMYYVMMYIRKVNSE